jgi:HK97 family phage prohead protease
MPLDKPKDNEMLTRSISTELNLCASDAEEGTFEGHAAIFGKLNSFDEIVMPGAFKKTLKVRAKGKVKMLRQHRQDTIIGVWEELREDKDGLFVRGKLLTEIQAAKETLILLKAKALDGLSIGFRTIVEEFDSKKKQIRLLELDLFEISLVAIPSQAAALVTSVRAMSPEEITTKRELEIALRDANFSVSTSKYIAAGWNPPARRDAEGEVVKRIRRLTESLTATGN